MNADQRSSVACFFDRVICKRPSPGGFDKLACAESQAAAVHALLLFDCVQQYDGNAVVLDAFYLAVLIVCHKKGLDPFDIFRAKAQVAPPALFPSSFCAKPRPSPKAREPVLPIAAAKS
jgi:hypothetical protein